MPGKHSVEAHVIGAIREVLGNKAVEVPDLGLTTPIDDSLDMDSLDWAEVVIRLEEELGIDPFENQDAGSMELNTIADMVSLYQGSANAPS